MTSRLEREYTPRGQRMLATTHQHAAPTNADIGTPQCSSGSGRTPSIHGSRGLRPPSPTHRLSVHSWLRLQVREHSVVPQELVLDPHSLPPQTGLSQGSSTQALSVQT